VPKDSPPKKSCQKATGAGRWRGKYLEGGEGDRALTLFRPVGLGPNQCVPAECKAE
jgi:hypothetical protein